MKILKLKSFYLLSIILFSNFSTNSSIKKYVNISKCAKVITDTLLNKIGVKIDENKIELLTKIIENLWENPVELRFKAQFKTANTLLLSFVLGLISTKSIDYLLSNNDFYNSLKDFIHENNIDNHCIPILILTILYSTYNIYKINKNNNNILNFIKNLLNKFNYNNIIDENNPLSNSETDDSLPNSNIDKIIKKFIKKFITVEQVRKINNNPEQLEKDIKSFFISGQNNNFTDLCNNILCSKQKEFLTSIKSKLYKSKNNIDLKNIIDKFTIENLEKYHNLKKIEFKNLENYQNKIIEDLHNNKENALDKLKQILDENKFIELENYLNKN